MAVFNAVAKFGAKDNYTQTIQRMEKATGKFNKSAQRGFMATSRGLGKVQNAAKGLRTELVSFASIVSVATLLSVAATATKDYEVATASLKAITGATTAQMVQYDAVVQKVAKDRSPSS